jgi:RNA polymerase sigma factor (sigma-70 family)
MIVVESRFSRFRDDRIAFGAWVSGIAREVFIRAYRHHVRARRRSVTREAAQVPGPRRSSVIGAEAAAPHAGTNGRSVGEEDIERLREARARLGAADAELLRLRYSEGLSFSEIAVAMGLREGAARTRHCRAIKRLRKLMLEVTHDRSHDV